MGGKPNELAPVPPVIGPSDQNPQPWPVTGQSGAGGVEGLPAIVAPDTIETSKYGELIRIVGVRTPAGTVGEAIHPSRSVPSCERTWTLRTSLSANGPVIPSGQACSHG